MVSASAISLLYISIRHFAIFCQIGAKKQGPAGSPGWRQGAIQRLTTRLARWPRPRSSRTPAGVDDHRHDPSRDPIRRPPRPVHTLGECERGGAEMGCFVVIPVIKTSPGMGIINYAAYWNCHGRHFSPVRLDICITCIRLLA